MDHTGEFGSESSIYVVTKEVYLLLWIENAAPGTNVQPVTELSGCVCDCNKDLYIWIPLFGFSQLNCTATEFENWVFGQSKNQVWISNLQCGIYKTTLSIGMALKFHCLMGEHVIFGFENLGRNEVKCKCVPWAWGMNECITLQSTCYFQCQSAAATIFIKFHILDGLYYSVLCHFVNLFQCMGVVLRECFIHRNTEVSKLQLS